MRRSPLAKRLRPLRHRVELWLARAAIALVNALPERAALAFGAGLGRASTRVLRRRTRLARANLRFVYPEWSEARRRAVARESAAEFGRAAVEWARLPSLDEAELRARFELVGAENVEAAFASGRPILAATAHYGNWELVPAAVQTVRPGTRLVAVGRTLRNEALYELIRDRRTQHGSELVAQDARAILRALREGAVVGVLVDQYTTQRRGGVLVPFLGRRAWTNAGPALLALRTNAIVLPAHVERIEGARHRVVIGRPIELERTGDRAKDVLLATARIQQEVESWVRADPAPWLWSHRRFKRSPDAPDSLYD
jgi:KDO2-lipid IV(A) lauroyltransferase